MELGLTGRACVVTGASRGIGRAVARALCAEGARVLMTARGAEMLDAAVVAAGAAGGEAAGVALDVTAPDAGERLVAECVARFGAIDVVVNNAGTSERRALLELTDADWQAQWELHVMAPLRLMRAAVPRMAQAGWGRVVNVSSSAGKRPSQSNGAYAVTKAAELSLSRTFADAFAGRGVLVNAVTPGPVETPLWLAPGGMADQMAQATGTTRERALADQRAKVPLGRFGTEEEIAAVVVFLCSQAAGNVAGAAWSVDGGAVPGII